MFETEIDQLKKNNLYRSLKPIDCAQGSEIVIGGKRFINFSSNDYLGLAYSEDLIRSSSAALKRWGTGSGASRLISGSLKIHHELEEETAHYKHEAKSIVFSSGFTANLGVIPSIVRANDTVWVDRYSHASIIEGVRASSARLRVYPHKDLTKLSDLLKRSKSQRNLVVTDSYFSMDGDFVDLEELVKVCRDYKALLLVDEAHATGIFGKKGTGLTEHFGVEGKIDFVMGTFSKAFGSQGGFVAGSESTVDGLINKARSFIYSTGPNPASSAASLAAIRLVKNNSFLRDRLWENVRLLREMLIQNDFDLMGSEGPIIPILIGDTKRSLTFAAKLYEEGIYIPAIRPPTVPKGTDRLRITVTAKHSEEDISRLVETLVRVTQNGASHRR